ncbi:MAG TPA: succinate dehydrogenase, cytochrome b556 subunit [Nevskiaceae bacterium]|nr:succinate dehydrogenase, cytochrome b556 subunit [Nevskiaceae bacterium]
MSKPTASRPLSPFMIGPYYRPQLTSMLSITHRATGVALSLGTLLLAGWLMALAAGPQTFDAYAVHVGAWYGQLLLIGWSWALLYHLCNGIRHLFWDAGYGLEIKTAYASGYAVVALSALLTAACWGLAYAL